MGLFSGGARGLFGSDPISKLARAQALMGGDYGSAAGIQANMQDAQAKRAKAEASMQMEGRVRAGLKARGLSDGDIDVIMANPDRASDLVYEALKTREGGPGGISVRNIDPATGAPKYELSPRVDSDGNFYGAWDGKGKPPLIQEGFKTVPVAPGGQVAVIGAATGQERVPGAATGPKGAPLTGPQPGEVVDGYRFKGGDPNDPNAWEQAGGASPTGSRTFP